MKTMILLAFCATLLPVGGTLLEFPIQGTAPAAKIAAIGPAITFETWDCREHPAKDPGVVQLLRCATCKKAMNRSDAKDDQEHRPRVEVKQDRLTIVSGPWTGIGLLRLSTITAALKDTGLSLLGKGMRLRGHVLFELTATRQSKPEALRLALGAFGVVEGEPVPGPVLLRLAEKKEAVEYEAVAAAIRDAGYAVKDTLWIVNQCCGELVTAR
jgi:hypothetical protein